MNVANWEPVKLGEHCEVFSGYPFKSNQFTDNPDDVALVKGENVGQGSILWSISKYWPRDDLNQLHRFKLVPGDVVLAMDRPWVPAGLKFARIPDWAPEALLVQRVARLRAKNGLEQAFLPYIISSPNFVAYVQNIGRGVGVPHISGREIESFAFNLPPKRIQVEIAELLLRYDELIDTNHRQMALLEKAAHLLYQEWFVHLRFPGHEHVPITDGLPQGWKKVKIRELLFRFARKKKIQRVSYLVSGDIPCVDQSADFIGGFTNDTDALHAEPLPMIVFGDHTRALKFVNFPFASGADGTQLIYPNRKGLSPEFFYCALSAIDLSNFFYARHFKFLKEEEILLPQEPLIREFTHFAAPCFRQIQILRNQNQRLSYARDLLLPRLISGEIKV